MIVAPRLSVEMIWVLGDARFHAFPQGVGSRITAFSPGTGTSFSMLPAEERVKVAQRRPVRLEIDRAPGERPIAPWLGADVTVDVRAHGS
jgi:membrane fusion protein, multidrug efflux system